MIDLGLVGLGRYGRRLLEAVQGRSTKIRFAAAAVRNASAAEPVARQFGVPLAGSFEELLALPDIKGVVLATPHSIHAEQTKQAARAGKHVFVEKPFTLDAASAKEAAEACAAQGVVLAVGFNTRFRPEITELKRLVDAGALGTILHVEGNISGPPGAGLDRAADNWRYSRAENPAGGMTGKGIHLVDLMIWLCGAIGSVYAMSDRRVIGIPLDDTTSMLFRFEGGATGYLGTVLSTPPYWRLRVFGSDGWVEVGDDRRMTLRRQGAEPVGRTFPAVSTQLAELEAFADAILGRGDYPVSISEAVHGCAVLEAIDRSAADGVQVRPGGSAA